jgi:hypothetical protein
MLLLEERPGPELGQRTVDALQHQTRCTHGGSSKLEESECVPAQPESRDEGDEKQPDAAGRDDHVGSK